MTTLVGTDGNDLIEGGQFEDVISGLDGRDTLFGLGGNDRLDGGGGNDILFAGANYFGFPGGDGDNQLSGGDGADSIYGGYGNDTLIGGEGDDFLQEYQLGGDSLTRNILSGGNGNDVIMGSGGTDTLDGGSGNDRLTSVRVGSGFLDDLLLGGDGNDSLEATQARLEGGNGNDSFLVASFGPSSKTDVEMLGGSGIDTYRVETGFDYPGLEAVVRSLDFQPGVGGDVIDLDFYIATARRYGLSGSDDAFDPRLAFLRVVKGSAGAALQFDLDGANGTNHGWQTVLGLRGVDAAKLKLANNFINADFVQSLTTVGGTTTAPTVAKPIADQSATPGVAFGFQIPLETFRDDDVGDKIALNVTLADGSPLPEWLSVQAFNRSIGGTPPTAGPLTPPTIRVTATDTLGLSVSDTFVISLSTAGNDSLMGTAGADRISGLAGNDTIMGGSGNDTLSGGDGNDLLDGGSSGDSLTGGAGNDRYVVQNSADKVVEASGGGTDSVSSSITYTLSGYVEKLTLTGTSAINGGGNGSNNTINGNSAINSLEGGDGNDSLVGMEGVDTLIGGNGNDLLDGGTSGDSMTGGAGNDRYVVQNTADKVIEASGGGTDSVSSSISHTLASNVEKLTLTGSAALEGHGNSLNNTIVGNSGANLLRGSTGNDTLTGGAGIDVFRFSSALNGSTNVDTVLDFSLTDDVLQLENTIFTKLTTTGVLSSSNFRANTSGSASDSNDYVLYETDTGKLYYDVDGSGAGVKVLFATLSTMATLTSADIFVT